MQKVGYSAQMTAGSVAKATDMSDLIVYTELVDVPGGNIAYTPVQTDVDASVAEASEKAVQVGLSEQTIPGAIVSYSTNDTQAAASALEYYATGMQLALFSGNTITALDQHMQYSPSEVSSSKKSADELSELLEFVELYIPLVILAIGADVIVCALIVRPRKKIG